MYEENHDSSSMEELGLENDEMKEVKALELQIRGKWERNGNLLGKLIDCQYDFDAAQFSLRFENDDNWYY